MMDAITNLHNRIFLQRAAGQNAAAALGHDASSGKRSIAEPRDGTEDKKGKRSRQVDALHE